MSYITRQDLEQRYGDEITQREAGLPVGALDMAILDAAALINGYLTGRYALPLVPVPASLPLQAAAIARYLLLGDAATERSRLDYQDAIAWLKDVAAGRVQFDQVAPEAAAAPAATVMVAGGDAVFKRTGRP